MIPITIGSYPILDQPPNYFDSINTTIAPTSEMSANANSNSNFDSNVSENVNVNVNGGVLHSTISNILNNEQVVRPQPISPPFEDAKTADAEASVPFPQHG